MFNWDEDFDDIVKPGDLKRHKTPETIPQSPGSGLESIAAVTQGRPLAERTFHKPESMATHVPHVLHDAAHPIPPARAVETPPQAAPVAPDQPRAARAFDWDEDQTDVQRHTAIPIDHGVPHRKPARGLRALMVYWVIPGALVAGLAGAGVFAAFQSRDSATGGGAIGGMLADLMDTGIGPMPDDLLVYAEVQYRNLATGLRQTSDADLLALAERTALDLRSVSDPMTAYMLDSLALAEREILRRGLDLPVAAANAEDARESFRTAARSL